MIEEKIMLENFINNLKKNTKLFQEKETKIDILTGNFVYDLEKSEFISTRRFKINDEYLQHISYEKLNSLGDKNGTPKYFAFMNYNTIILNPIPCQDTILYIYSMELEECHQKVILECRKKMKIEEEK